MYVVIDLFLLVEEKKKKKKKKKTDSYYGNHPKVTTVDKYQGQQNDFVLLSLVRTERAGHIWDTRRLVVALSRSRLGLYIFGKTDLFSEVWELKSAMKALLDRPTKLSLCTDEVKNTTTRKHDETGTEQLTVCYYLRLILSEIMLS